MGREDEFAGDSNGIGAVRLPARRVSPPLLRSSSPTFLITSIARPGNRSRSALHRTLPTAIGETRAVLSVHPEFILSEGEVQF